MTGMWKVLTAAVAAALLATGCESFRKGGDSEKPPAAGSRKSKAKRRRDPRDDMFLGIGSGARAESFSRDGLSPQEQSLLDAELRREEDEMGDLRRRRRNMDPDRSKRKQWVYGFKPLGSDR